MTDHRIGFIGTGADPDNPSATGFAMAYAHADAYRRIDDCELVACADIVPENARAFADAQGIANEHVYEDHQAMLAEAEPDIVSVCVPPVAHADLTIDCCEHDAVDAVHCEKPMALTFGGAREMAAAAEGTDTQLTFNHQRRFADLFRAAKAHVDEGAVGDVERVVYTWGNFYDNGTHAVDMCNYFVDETPAEWVLGGLDYSEERLIFGTHNENQMFAHWRYENGVQGVAATGPSAGLVPADWRIEGTEGRIDIDLSDAHALEVTRFGEGTEREEFERGDDWIARAIADVVAALDEGRPCELRAENAMKATEIIFGGFHSVRERGRVELPPEIDDNPIHEMVDSGALTPESSE